MSATRLLFKGLRLPSAERPEGVLVRAVLDFLRARGIPAWRNNTGAATYRDGRGGRRFVRFGPPGAPDILAVVPPAGRLLAVEAKRGRNRLTREQADFLDTLRAAGALAVVAYSVGDVRAALAASTRTGGIDESREKGGLAGVAPADAAGVLEQILAAPRG